MKTSAVLLSGKCKLLVAARKGNCQINGCSTYNFYKI